MTATSIRCFVVLLVTLCSGMTFAQPGPGMTNFTYQGQLRQGGVPQDGPCDLKFSLFNVVGDPVGSPQDKAAVPLSKGLFTVELDFGPVFDGSERFIEIATRCPAGVGTFTTLAPRQAVTWLPYAQFANSIPLGSITADHIAQDTILPPSGPAGGSLAGTYPDPSLAPGSVGSAELKSDRGSMAKVSGGAMGVDSSNNVSVGGVFASLGKLEAFNTSGIALLGTSTSRAVVGRLGVGTSCAGTYAVGGCAGPGTETGVMGSAEFGSAVQGIASGATGTGVLGQGGFGVIGQGPNGIGVLGDSNARGIVGRLNGGSCPGTFGVGGCTGTAGTDGVRARATNGVAMRAEVTDVTGNIFVGMFGGNQARINSQGRGFFNGGTQDGGADFAESMRTTDDPAALEPGDVLEMDPARPSTVRRSRGAQSLLVAGVYSTRPAVLAVGSHGVDDTLDGEVPVGIVGIVPTKVTDENGPIAIGDLLVSASRPGHAMKARPAMVSGVPVYPTGAILGKALAPLRAGTGTIEVLVSLR